MRRMRPTCEIPKAKVRICITNYQNNYRCIIAINILVSHIVRFRLEVDVKDDSAHTVVVMWDETAKDLTKSGAKALLDGLDAVHV